MPRLLTKESIAERIEVLKLKKKERDLKFELGRESIYQAFMEMYSKNKDIVLESVFHNVFPNSSIISQADYLNDGKVMLKINVVPDINEPNKITSLVDVFDSKEMKERAKQLLDEALKLALRLNPYE